MSLAETTLAEITEPIVVLPVPGNYQVKSSGTLLVPTNADVDIVASVVPGGKPDLIVNNESRGSIDILSNGDFEVTYPDGDDMLIRIQFRQSGDNNEFLYGVVIPEKIIPPAPQDDPPITGVWGAEARPPQEPDPEG